MLMLEVLEGMEGLRSLRLSFGRSWNATKAGIQ